MENATATEEKNVYALLNFKRTYETPDDKEGTQKFQPITFYKLNPDGSYQNGTTLEEMLKVSLERLIDLDGRFSCEENANTIIKIEEAIMWLNKRTENRKARNVEGKHII